MADAEPLATIVIYPDGEFKIVSGGEPVDPEGKLPPGLENREKARAITQALERALYVVKRVAQGGG